MFITHIHLPHLCLSLAAETIATLEEFVSESVCDGWGSSVLHLYLEDVRVFLPVQPAVNMSTFSGAAGLIWDLCSL